VIKFLIYRAFLFFLYKIRYIILLTNLGKVDKVGFSQKWFFSCLVLGGGCLELIKRVPLKLITELGAPGHARVAIDLLH
jgi:hypothetical protein